MPSISSGRPMRWLGELCSKIGSNSGVVMRVSNGPGWIALTVIL